MKTFSLIAGTVLISVCATVPASGQATDRPLAPSVPCIGLGLPPTDGCSEVEYDRFTGKTTSTLKFMFERGVDRHVVMMLIATRAGAPEHPAAPEWIGISFSTFNSELDSAYRTDHTLYVLLDGERIILQLERLRSDYSNGRYSETLARLVKLTDVQKIAAAKKLEMKLRGDEFILDASQMNHIRVFVSRLSK